ncbi:DNA ligase [Streptomyces sp. NPDC050538]|uniref:ATP-dependent DNA ligase n=1 Tax=Streptomyces sp. NPDC050538 TaxID=3365627 RepID=UPI0037876C00
MEFPVQVALAELVPVLPTAPGWWFEIKLDGHRTVMWRTADGVRLQARSGRDVTANWMDIALPGMRLPPGVVLDGEAVVVVDERISFEAAQSRAASAPARARRLAEEHPALYVVWDVLSLPTGAVRGRPYVERRAMMLDVLAGLPSPSPIQAVSATDDLSVAQAWYDSLQDTGVEGVVAKLGTSPYRSGHSSSWKKIRHAETTDAAMVGYTGPTKRPRALVVRLPDGRVRLTRAIGAQLAAQVAALLTLSEPGRTAALGTGEVYTAVVVDLMVEVLAETTRHAVVTATRLR